MIHVNEHFSKLAESYLFSQVKAQVCNFANQHPDANVIRMDIGDVTRPICQAAIKALHKATDEMSYSKTFHGYGPEQGYEFLRNAICQNDYLNRGINITPSEIFISDGAKSDLGNITDLLGKNSQVAVTDPVYPVYVDSNIIAGHGADLIYLPCIEQNNFLPEIPSQRLDAIYLCFPNNPTGVSISTEKLAEWVEYALANNTLILFDSAYEAFVQTPGAVKSIYEIEGARKVAIEFRSFSKTAGFTGLRCGYTVVPDELEGIFTNGKVCSLNRLWNRRQCTKFNGTSYPIQRAAEALYTPEGKEQVRQNIEYYQRNASLLRDNLIRAGFQIFGGIDSPYIWWKAPHGQNSWQFFHTLLELAHVTSTPGIGFGTCGQGYVRLTAFNTYENTLKAVESILQNIL